MAETTAGGVQVGMALEALRRLGLREPAAFAQRLDVGFEPSVESRLGFVSMVRLLEAAGRELNDPLTGLRVGAQARSNALHLAFEACPSLAERFRIFARTLPWFMDFMRVEVADTPEAVELAIELADASMAGNVTAVDYSVASSLSELTSAWPGLVPIEGAWCTRKWDRRGSSSGRSVARCSSPQRAT